MTTLLVCTGHDRIVAFITGFEIAGAFLFQVLFNACTVCATWGAFFNLEPHRRGGKNNYANVSQTASPFKIKS